MPNFDTCIQQQTKKKFFYIVIKKSKSLPLENEKRYNLNKKTESNDDKKNNNTSFNFFTSKFFFANYIKRTGKEFNVEYRTKGCIRARQLSHYQRRKYLLKQPCTIPSLHRSSSTNRSKCNQDSVVYQREKLERSTSKWRDNRYCK